MVQTVAPGESCHFVEEVNLERSPQDLSHD
jgi:hypothetical protein